MVSGKLRNTYRGNNRVFKMITKIIILIDVTLTILGNEIFDNSMGVAEFKYRGENFPVKFLIPEDILPTKSDLKHYVKSLKRTVDYFSKVPNNTDCNKALGLFYMKSLLKRTLQDDYDNIINSNQYAVIKNIINKAENVLSHYIYINYPYGWRDLEFRVSRLFKFDEPQIYSIGKFNRNKLKKWIYAVDKMNDYHKEIDDATLPKEKYVDITMSMDKNFPIKDSDVCISRIALNPVPVHVQELRPCLPDPECEGHIFATPSIAYSLSHRLVNLMALRHFRRCYLHSEKDEETYMEVMCSYMYREVVYLARRGYFARDIFMEHIALCSLLGYEEFHRRNWFHKTASWVDENGCVQEDRNFNINLTKIELNRQTNPKRLSKLKRMKKWLLTEECQNHPMAMLVVVLAHGIRHAAHFMPKTSGNLR